MLLAVWSVLGGLDIKAMSALRTLLVSATNAVAVLCFVAAMSAPEWALAQPCSFLPGNAFQNCGFETGDLSAWSAAS